MRPTSHNSYLSASDRASIANRAPSRVLPVVVMVAGAAAGVGCYYYDPDLAPLLIVGCIGFALLHATVTRGGNLGLMFMCAGIAAAVVIGVWLASIADIDLREQVELRTPPAVAHAVEPALRYLPAPRKVAPVAAAPQPVPQMQPSVVAPADKPPTNGATKHAVRHRRARPGAGARPKVKSRINVDPRPPSPPRTPGTTFQKE